MVFKGKTFSIPAAGTRNTGSVSTSQMVRGTFLLNMSVLEFSYRKEYYLTHGSGTKLCHCIVSLYNMCCKKESRHFYIGL